MKRAFKYRFYPTDAQAVELSRMFGCVRKVYNMALAARTEVAVDRFFPSSRLCSVRGARRERLPLHVRAWTCACGTTHDRDVNAAHNLLAAGLAVSVRGAGAIPQRESSRTGQSATKQKTSRREP